MMIHDHHVRGLRFAARLGDEAAVVEAAADPRQLSTVEVIALRSPSSFSRSSSSVRSPRALARPQVATPIVALGSVLIDEPQRRGLDVQDEGALRRAAVAIGDRQRDREAAGLVETVQSIVPDGSSVRPGGSVAFPR